MATKALKQPILVYRLVKSGLLSSKLGKTSEYGADDFAGVPPICLLYNNNHYDLLQVVG